MLSRRPGRSTSSRVSASQGLGDHQVDGDSRRAEPGTWLSAAQVLTEASGAHRLLDARVVSQLTRVERQVAVLGRLRQRDVGAAGVQIDRLRADQHDGVLLFVKRLQGVEQGTARLDEGVTCARHIHCSPSNRAAPALRRGCARVQ